MLMSEAFAELQNRDEKSQLRAKTEDDERLHAEQMNSILHQGPAGTARPQISFGTRRRNSRG